MNKYFCDACKKEITEWEEPDYRQWNEGEDDHHVDLCLSCHNKLLLFFRKIGVKI